MNHIGIDIGSISVKAVLMDESGRIFNKSYVRTHGQPVKTTLKVLEHILSGFRQSDIGGIAITGTGGTMISDILNGYFVNEIIAQSSSTSKLHPEIRTIIEIGGEDSKLIKLEHDSLTGISRLNDFNMNTVCAAGTGSFLDQQAVRLGVSIEEEFGELAVKSSHPPRIAGRCSVFAKSDMIHLQQMATQTHDILMGLCLAMARNFKSNITKSMELERPISFHGGVAANKGMVKAFENTLNMKAGELFIPEHYAYMGAIGAVFSMLESNNIKPFKGLTSLENHLHKKSGNTKSYEPLKRENYEYYVEPVNIQENLPVNAYLGIDVGSISTNLVVIDDKKRVIARRYLKTAGNPIEAVRQGLDEIGKENGNKVVIKGAATTGSGRYLTADFVGADVVKNEITAHAKGAINVNPDVDTIFEIGGQDSKYISLKKGKVVDFTMNKVCAAGTGSFLEEQAEKLGINIKEEFGELALASKSPAALGERCTVFMESSLNHEQQIGTSKEDLVAGLSYSIVLNYLTTVVEDRNVGDVIFFQGGTAYNRGIKAAFEKICGKKVIVPPQHDVLGAMGAAILAMQNNPKNYSTFKGFDLANRKFTVDSFECEQCSNTCEIRTVSIEGEKPLKYGSRCGKFDEERRPSLGKTIPKLFDEREKLLLSTYTPTTNLSEDAPVIGIPRSLLFYEMFPFWNAFFKELGFNVIISPQTGRKLVNKGCEAIIEEVCFPVKVGLGHVIELLDKKVDYLFLPSIINAKPFHEDANNACICPIVQGFPYMANATLNFEKYSSKVLKPVFHFGNGEKFIKKELKSFAQSLGINSTKADTAINKGFENLASFRNSLLKRGEEVLNNLTSNTPSVVIVSRPYNGCDPGLNLSIPDKLRDMGVMAIPADFLPPTTNGVDYMSNMYWRYGQQILSAGDSIANNPSLNAIYITNFACGPDSFIMKYFSKIMKDKHYLTLELDEHSGDAGVITRLEAFIDSLQTSKDISYSKAQKQKTQHIFSNHRKIYIPYMDDHGIGVAAAMRHYDIEAESLPLSNEKSLEFARKYTTGKECYPFLITTGDILQKVFSKDFDPKKASFFMPTTNGPCRFGQYCHSHKLVMEEAGKEQVHMIKFNQNNNHDNELNKLGKGFQLLSWQAIVAIDNLKKLLYQTRPYEINKGETDKVYKKCLDYLEKTVENNGSIKDTADFAARVFKSIPVDRSKKKPVIGIIGEIFVRSNDFSNNNIIRRIESLGGEVVVPTLQEWMLYTDWEKRIDYIRSKQYKQYFSEVIKSFIQKHYSRKESKPLEDTVKHFLHEMPTGELIKLSKPYMTEHLRGEAILSMAKAEEYAIHGLNGVVNLTPFHCMPGTIANTLLCQFSKKYPNIPVLKMVYDGTKQPSEETKLEAFMFQAKQSTDVNTKASA